MWKPRAKLWILPTLALLWGAFSQAGPLELDSAPVQVPEPVCVRALTESDFGQGYERFDLPSERHLHLEIQRLEEAYGRYYRKGFYGKKPGTAFFESLDNALRSNSKIPGYLLDVTLNRLPYLKQRHFVIVLSGALGDQWTEPLFSYAEERGLSVSLLKLPGGLNRSADIEQLSVQLRPWRGLFESSPAIFLDDSYSGGGTAKTVRSFVESAGGRLDGVFVAYDSSRGDAASLYKSGRLNTRAQSLGCFPQPVQSWSWAKEPLRLGVEFYGTLALAEAKTYRLTRQGERFLEAMNQLGARMVLLNHAHSMAVPRAIRKRFSSIRFELPVEGADFALGNFGRKFSMVETFHDVPGYRGTIETMRIGAVNQIGVALERNLSADYLLEALANRGLLMPRYEPSFEETAAALGGGRRQGSEREILDLAAIRPSRKVFEAPLRKGNVAVSTWLNPEARLRVVEYFQKRVFRDQPELAKAMVSSLDQLFKGRSLPGDEVVAAQLRERYLSLNVKKHEDQKQEHERSRIEKRVVQISQVFKTPPRRFLDVGAGDGSITGALAMAWGLNPQDALAVDVLVPSNAVGFTYRKLRPEMVRLPADPSSFDGALISMVFHHLPHPEPLMAELNRVLKPGGTLVVREADAGNRNTVVFNAFVDWFFYAVVDASPEVPTPNNFLGEAVWLRLLGEAGFELVESHHLEPNNPLNPFQAVLKKK